MQKINDKGDARMAPALMLLAVAAGAVEEALAAAVDLMLVWVVMELLEEVTVVDTKVVVDALVEEEVLEDVVEDEAVVEVLDALVDVCDFVDDDDDDDAEEEVTVESMLNRGE